MAYERELTLYRFTQRYVQRLMEDIPEENLSLQPCANVNTPRWILGHLTIGCDYGLGILDQPGLCDKRWFAEFGPGSSPSEIRLKLTKGQLLAAFDAGHAALSAAVAVASPEKLAVPHTLPLPFIQEMLPTKSDLLCHLISTHEAAHAGQLTYWRRCMGMANLPF